MKTNKISVKHKFGLLIKNSLLFNFFSIINLIFFHWQEHAHWIRRDKNLCSKYFVIKSRGDNEGLISLYFAVANGVNTALKYGMIPVVDMRENCQYLVDRVVNNTNNAWEYYFKQPFNKSIEDIFNEKNIFINGWAFNYPFPTNPLIRNVSNVQKNGNVRKICRTYLQVNDTVKLKAEEQYEKLLADYRGEVVGVYIRGTDYIKMSPKGHPVQPSFIDMIDKTEEFINKYPIRKIFLVTEDYRYYLHFCEYFGDMVVTSDNEFVKDYSGDDYLSYTLNSDPYERGLNYLIRLLILSKSDYLVSSITNGSLFSRCMMDEDPIDEYWFDLGTY